MARSTEPAGEAYLWMWPPGGSDPIVVGRLDQQGPVITFTYGRSYLSRRDAIALYLPELPLIDEVIDPLVGEIAGCVRDAGPDGWGQRVIENDHASNDLTNHPLGTLDYLLRGSADGIGALSFSSSVDDVPATGASTPSLEELATSAERVEEGVGLDPVIDRALLHGTTVGGARPKALLRDGPRSLIAKFSSSTDPRPVMKGEFVAMELARRVGLDVAPVEIVRVLGRDVVLVERFDRRAGGGRRSMVSALTILGLDEIGARYATYWELANVIRARFTRPEQTLRELFSRIVFNVLVGNTDDHPRNHAAFWDGRELTLTPAYDICPQPRIGGEQQQAMAIAEDGFRFSQVQGCVQRCGTYHLAAGEARAIVEQQIQTIHDHWSEVCDLAAMSEVERRQFWGREILSPFTLEGFT